MIPKKLAYIALIAVLTLVVINGSPDVADAAIQQGPVSGLAEYTFDGLLTITWGDTFKGQAMPPEYRLHLDDGTSMLLDLSSASVLEPGTAMQGTRVKVAGARLPVAGEAFAPSKLSALQGGNSPAAAPPITGSQPWVTIMCRFPGADEPTSSFAELASMLLDSSTANGIGYYWNEAAFGAFGTQGSAMGGTGWRNMPLPLAAYAAPEAGRGIDYGRMAADCTGLFDNVVTYSQFVGVNMHFNMSLDINGGCDCAFGGSSLLNRDGVQGFYRTTWMAPWSQMAVYAHEMGHAFGLPHSSGGYGQTYNSGWDVMSAPGGTCELQFPAPVACRPQHTIAYHKSLIGILTQADVFLPGTNSSTLVQLAPLELENPPGTYQMLKIPVSGRDFDFYTIELRRRIGYDINSPAGPAGALVIHKVRDRDFAWPEPAVVVDLDLDGDPNDCSPQSCQNTTNDARWTTGEVFRDPALQLLMKMVSPGVGSQPATVAVRRGNPPLVRTGIGFIQQPSENATIGLPLLVQPSVATVAADTLPMSADNQTPITISVQEPGASVFCIGGNTRTVNGGEALFSGCVLTGTPGPYTLRASAPGSPSIQSSVVNLQAPRCFALSFTIEPAATVGSATPDESSCPGGGYTPGEELHLRAEAADGFGFAYWAGDAQGAANPHEFTITKDSAVTATFGMDLSPGAAPVAGSVALDAWKLYFADIPPGVTTLRVNLTPLSGDSDLYVKFGSAPTFQAADCRPFSGAVPERCVFFAPQTGRWWFGVRGYTPASFAISISTTGGCFSVVTAVEPEQSGTISLSPAPTCPGGKYLHGTAVHASASPAAGFTFASWSGDSPSLANPLELDAQGDIAITAAFVPACVTLNRSISPANAGTLTVEPPPNCSAGRYLPGTAVSITASPSEGYSFVGWTGSANGNANPLALTLDQDTSIGGTLARTCAPFTLTISPAVSGSVSRTTENCPGGYTVGTHISLTAQDGNGFTFQGWEGDVDELWNPLNTQILGATGIEAKFAAACYYVFVVEDPPGAGSVTVTPPNCAGGRYLPGTAVSLQATALPGHAFGEWLGDAAGSLNPLQVTVTTDIVIGAQFSTTSCSSPEGYFCAEYYNNATLSGLPAFTSLETQVNANYGTGSPHPSIQVDNFSARFLRTVSFTEGVYEFSYSTNDGMRVFIDNVLVIDKWTHPQEISNGVSSVPVSSGAHVLRIEFYDTTGTARINVQWQLKSPACYDVETDQSPANSGFLSISPEENCPTGSGYAAGTIIQMWQFTFTGWEFTGWTGDYSGPQDATIFVVVDRDLQITAARTQVCFSVFVDILPEFSAGVEITPAPDCGGRYTEGTIVNVTPFPGWNREFSSWTGDIESTSPGLSIPLTGDVHLTLTTSVRECTAAIGQYCIEWYTGVGDDAEFVYSDIFGPVVNINFGAPGPITVRWTGDFVFNATPYRFYYYANGGIRATVDGEEMFDTWDSPSAPGTVVVRDMTAGTHHIVVEYFSVDAPAVAQVLWSRATTPCFELSLLAIPANGGAVSASAPNCGTGRYIEGTAVSLTATPSPGLTLATWDGDASGQVNPLVLTMDGPKSIAAHFAVPGDDPSNSLMISGPNTFRTLDLAAATMSALDPFVVPGGQCQQSTQLNHSVWTQYTPLGAGLVRVDAVGPGLQPVALAFSEGMQQLSCAHGSDGNTALLTRHVDGTSSLIFEFGSLLSLATGSVDVRIEWFELHDANCNHLVDAVDALAALQLLAGIADYSRCPADPDANGILNIADALLVRQAIAGLLTPP